MKYKDYDFPFSIIGDDFDSSVIGQLIVRIMGNSLYVGFATEKDSNGHRWTLQRNGKDLSINTEV